MIWLRFNFTEAEQSDMLLQIGLPADSADCFYDSSFGYNFRLVRNYGTWSGKSTMWDTFKKGLTPCWSAGQLLWICKTCTDGDLGGFIIRKYLKSLSIQELVTNIYFYSEFMDFSKLEDGL